MTIDRTAFFKMTLYDFFFFAFVLTVVYLLTFFIIKKTESYIQRKQFENDIELLVDRLNYEFEKISCKQLRTAEKLTED